MFSCELSEILGTPILKTAVSVYCEAIINLEKSLLVHDLLLIDLTELYQKYENKRYASGRLQI